MADDAMFAPLATGSDPARSAGAAGRSKPVPIVPVPADAPQCTWRHPKHGAPVVMWPYRNADGRLVGYAARVEYDGADGKPEKDVLPITYCRVEHAKGHRHGWRARALPAPRPLYRLPELLAAAEAPVIVTEGEKKADVVPVLFLGHVGTTSMGGAKAAKKSDWATLAGHPVIIWPDHDEPGRDYAKDVARLATAADAASVAIVAVPSEWPAGWDLADPLPEGAAPGMLAELLQSAVPYQAETEAATAGETAENGIDADAEILRLAKTPALNYARERTGAAKNLKVTVNWLDKLVRMKQSELAKEGSEGGQGRPINLPEPERWPQRMDGAALLDEMTAAIRQYVILTEHQAEAIALWAVFTHAFDAFDFSPKLVISSAEKRSGKTRLVEVLDRIVRKPLFISGISAAALLRVIDRYTPSMLLDEIDTMMRGGDVELREALRGLINSSFDRAGARFIKNVPTPGGGYEPAGFSTWCPMLFAGIGKVPDTVADRAILIEMERKRLDEKVKPLRAGDGDELRDLGRKAARWATDNLAALRCARPQPPAQIHDRAADAWSPLFAIADVAVGPWPERARRTAIELSADGEDSMSAGVLLLADLRELFAGQQSGVLFTREILKALHADETRPWPEWKNGRPITERQLAALLKPYKVKPRTVRRGLETDKGYKLEWFAAPFASYLPPCDPSLRYNQAFPRVTTETDPSHSRNEVTDSISRKTSVSTACDAVTDKNGSDPPKSERAGAVRCRWYVTNGTGHRLCGKPAVPGTEYCAQHPLHPVGTP
jgi:hypothetical protein